MPIQTRRREEKSSNKQKTNNTKSVKRTEPKEKVKPEVKKEEVKPEPPPPKLFINPNAGADDLPQNLVKLIYDVNFGEEAGVTQKFYKVYDKYNSKQRTQLLDQIIIEQRELNDELLEVVRLKDQLIRDNDHSTEGRSMKMKLQRQMGDINLTLGRLQQFYEEQTSFARMVNKKRLKQQEVLIFEEEDDEEPVQRAQQKKVKINDDPLPEEIPQQQATVFSPTIIQQKQTNPPSAIVVPQTIEEEKKQDQVQIDTSVQAEAMQDQQLDQMAEAIIDEPQVVQEEEVPEQIDTNFQISKIEKKKKPFKFSVHEHALQDLFVVDDHDDYKYTDLTDEVLQKELMPLPKYVQDNWSEIGLRPDLEGAPFYRRFLQKYTDPEYLAKFFGNPLSKEVSGYQIQFDTPIGYLQSLNLVSRSQPKKIGDNYTIHDFNEYFYNLTALGELAESMVANKDKELLSTLPSLLAKESESYFNGNYQKLYDESTKEAYTQNVVMALSIQKLINLMSPLHQGNFLYGLSMYDNPLEKHVEVDREKSITPEELAPYEKTGRIYYNFSPFSSLKGKHAFSNMISEFYRFLNGSAITLQENRNYSIQKKETTKTDYIVKALDLYLGPQPVVLGLDNSYITKDNRDMFQQQGVYDFFYRKSELDGNHNVYNGIVSIEDSQKVMQIMMRLFGKNSVFQKTLPPLDQYQDMSTDDYLKQLDDRKYQEQPKIKTVAEDINSRMDEMRFVLKRDYNLMARDLHQKAYDLQKQMVQNQTVDLNKTKLTDYEVAKQWDTGDQLIAQKKQQEAKLAAEAKYGKAPPKKKAIKIQPMATKIEIKCALCNLIIGETQPRIGTDCLRFTHQECFNSQFDPIERLCPVCKQFIPKEQNKRELAQKEQKDMQDIQQNKNDMKYDAGDYPDLTIDRLFDTAVTMYLEKNLEMLKQNRKDLYDQIYQQAKEKLKKRNPFLSDPSLEPTNEQIEEELFIREKQGTVSDVIRLFEETFSPAPEYNERTVELHSILDDILWQLKKEREDFQQYKAVVDTVKTGKTAKVSEKEELIDKNYKFTPDELEVEKTAEQIGEEEQENPDEVLKYLLARKNVSEEELAKAKLYDQGLKIDINLPKSSKLFAQTIQANKQDELMTTEEHIKYLNSIHDSFPKRIYDEDADDIKGVLSKRKRAAPKESKPRPKRQKNEKIKQQEPSQQQPPVIEPVKEEVKQEVIPMEELKQEAIPMEEVKQEAIPIVEQKQIEEEVKQEPSPMELIQEIQELKQSMATNQQLQSQLGDHTFISDTISVTELQKEIEMDNKFSKQQQQILISQVQASINEARVVTYQQVEDFNTKADEQMLINTVDIPTSSLIEEQSQNYQKFDEAIMNNQFNIANQFDSMIDNTRQIITHREKEAEIYNKYRERLAVAEESKNLIEQQIASYKAGSEQMIIQAERETIRFKNELVELQKRKENQIKLAVQSEGLLKNLTENNKKVQQMKKKIQEDDSKIAQVMEQIEAQAKISEERQKKIVETQQLAAQQEKQIKELQEDSQMLVKNQQYFKQLTREMKNLIFLQKAAEAEIKQTKEGVKQAEDEVDKLRQAKELSEKKLLAIQGLKVKRDLQLDNERQNLKQAEQVLNSLNFPQAQDQIDEIVKIIQDIMITNPENQIKKQYMAGALKIKTDNLESTIQQSISQSEEALANAKRLRGKMIHQKFDYNISESNLKRVVDKTNELVQHFNKPQYIVTSGDSLETIYNKYVQAQQEIQSELQERQFSMNNLKHWAEKIDNVIRERKLQETTYLNTLKYSIKELDQPGSNIDTRTLQQMWQQLLNKPRGTISEQEQNQINEEIANVMENFRMQAQNQAGQNTVSQRVISRFQELYKTMNTLQLDAVRTNTNYRFMMDQLKLTDPTFVLQRQPDFLNQNEVTATQTYLRDEISMKQRAIETMRANYNQINSISQDLTKELQALKNQELKKEDLLYAIKHNILRASYDNKPDMTQIKAMNTVNELLQEQKKIIQQEDKQKKQISELQLDNDHMREQVALISSQQKQVQELLKEKKNLARQTNYGQLELVYLNEQLTKQNKMWEQMLQAKEQIREGKYDMMEEIAGIEKGSVAKIIGEAQNIDKFIANNEEIMPTKLIELIQNEGTVNDKLNKLAQSLVQGRVIQNPVLRETANQLNQIAFKMVNDFMKNAIKATMMSDKYKFTGLKDETLIGNLRANSAQNMVQQYMSFDQIGSQFDRLMTMDMDIARSLKQAQGEAQIKLQNSLQQETSSSIYAELIALQTVAKNFNSDMQSLENIPIAKLGQLQRQVQQHNIAIKDKLDKIYDIDQYNKIAKDVEKYSRQMVDLIITNPLNYKNSDFRVDKQRSISDMSVLLGDLTMKRIHTFIVNGGKSRTVQQEEELVKSIQRLEAQGIITQNDKAMIYDSCVSFMGDVFDNVKHEFFNSTAKIINDRLAPQLNKIDGQRLAKILTNTEEADKFIVQNVDPIYNRDYVSSKMKEIYTRFSDVIREERQNIIDQLISTEKKEKQESNEQIKEKAMKSVQNRLSTSENVYSGKSKFISSVRNSNQGLYGQLLPMITMSEIQKEISLTNKEELKGKMQQVAEEKKSLSRQLQEIYDIHQLNHVDMGELKKTRKTYMSYVINNVFPQLDNRVFMHRIDYQGKDFDQLEEDIKIKAAIETVNSIDEFLALTIAPYKKQVEVGSPLTRDQIMHLAAANNFIDFSYNVLDAMGADKLVAFMTSNNIRDPDDAEDIVSNLYGSKNIRQARNIENNKVSFGLIKQNAMNVIKQFIQESLDLQVATTENNMQMLDDVGLFINKRLKGETDIDKGKKVMEVLEREKEEIKEQIYNKIDSVGLRDFFKGDPQAQQQVNRVLNNSIPKYYPQIPPQVRNPFGLNGPSNQQQQQYQDSGYSGGFAQQQQQQPQRNFVAFQDSEAAQSGDSTKERLGKNAQKGAEETLSRDDFAFIMSIRYDASSGQLIIKDKDSGEERKLTKEEKRRFIKVLVFLILAMYQANIKKLSKEKQEKVKKKLERKQNEDQGALFRIVNKVAEKASGKTEEKY